MRKHLSAFFLVFAPLCRKNLCWVAEPSKCPRAGPMKQDVLVQAHNLRLLDAAGSRGTSSTRDQKTKTVNTSKINPRGPHLLFARQQKRIFLFFLWGDPIQNRPKFSAFSLLERVDLRSQKEEILGKKIAWGRVSWTRQKKEKRMRKKRRGSQGYQNQSFSNMLSGPFPPTLFPSFLSPLSPSGPVHSPTTSPLFTSPSIPPF